MARNENIQVALRFRPLSNKELDQDLCNIWRIYDNSVSLKPKWNQQLIDAKRTSNIPKQYHYNNCFSGKHSNEYVYEHLTRKVVLSSLEGYNGTIFAYGQTGSGKTYTMMGAEGAEWDRVMQERRKRKRSVSPMRNFREYRNSTPEPNGEPQSQGIIILALRDLFEQIQKYSEKTFYLTCCYLEIYNEQTYDLLADSPHSDGLTICEDPNRGFYVRNLSEHIVASMEDVLAYIKKGEANRRYAVTAMNHRSSRSHTIFRLNVTSVTSVSACEMKNTLGDEWEEDEEEENLDSITTESILNFVDLAGSERVSVLQDTGKCQISGTKRMLLNNSKIMQKRPGARSQHLDTLMTEGKHINTSLFYLCQVINRLSDKAASQSDVHVPYRNSNLTKILKSSLGGNALTCIICTATPGIDQYEMTLSTLRFGGKAKTITNQVAANIRSNKNAELLAAYQRDIDNLRKELEYAQQGGRNRADEAAQMKKQLEERIAKLSHMLFNQSRQPSLHDRQTKEGTDKQLELWTPQVGDLIVDRTLIDRNIVQKNLIYGHPSLKFDEKGIFALERLKIMHKELKKRDMEIADLRACKKNLIDSKFNLKNELKKALALCSEISKKKCQYKKQLQKVKQATKKIKERLSIFESPEALEELSYDQLGKLERFFYAALDNVKNARFKKQYDQEITRLKMQIPSLSESISCTAEQTKNYNEDSSLCKILGLQKLENSFGSFDSSLEFETSFYHNKQRQSMQSSFESQEGSTFMLAEMLGNVKNDFQSIKVPNFQENFWGEDPLVEVSPQMQNSQKRFHQ